MLCRVERGDLEWGCHAESPDAKAEDGKVGGVDISSPVNITTELHAAGLTLMQTFRKPGKEEGSRGDPSTLERMTWLLGHRPISQNTGYQNIPQGQEGPTLASKVCNSSLP